MMGSWAIGGFVGWFWRRQDPSPAGEELGWRSSLGAGGGWRYTPGQGSDSPPVFCTPDESSEEDEDEEDELEEEEDEADGSYRLGARERALSPGLEESGLGLLARFAASALPSPTVGPSLSVVQLEAKQKARKKEERQSLMGKYWQVCFWAVAPLPHPAGEETEAQRRVGAELGAGPALNRELVIGALACCAQGGVSKTMQSNLQTNMA